MNDRRRFLQFMGASAVAASLEHSPLIAKSLKTSSTPLKPLPPRSTDDFVVAEGLSFQILCREGDPIDSKGQIFGSDNDFTTFIPLNSHLPNDGFLWVNHEDVHPGLLHEFKFEKTRTKEQIDKERLMVGGSLLRIRRDPKTGKWNLVKDDPRVKRFSASSPIPFSKGIKILNQTQASGTLANCSGGKTPWGSILSCEEVYKEFYGERNFETGMIEGLHDGLQWSEFYPEPPEHYGWVVEINPLVGTAKKLISLGRFQHEGATCVLSKFQTLVVYMGDDQEDRCLYKFIAKDPGSLDEGVLYVASLEKRKWIPLVRDLQPQLQAKFKDQIEVLIRTREAAEILGGTKLNRPEGIAVHPRTKDVYLALTNNLKRSDAFGSILKIKEKNQDPLSLEFDFETYATGGPENDFACPDNLCFDNKGNLWMTSDFSSGSEPYKSFGNNSLYYLPLSGPQQGQTIRLASAPIGSELTGPSFSFDGRTLFLSVQHPGGNPKKPEDVKSHWPDGGNSLPRSAVVAISGPLLSRLTT